MLLLHPGGTVELVGVAHGEWYRLVTAGFLHVGIWHIALNMLALWFLGSQLEPLVGRVQFGVVYMTSLLAGSLGVIILSPNEVTVGASGAIFGLLGFAVAFQRSRGINIWQSGLGMILVLNLLFTFGVNGISIGGHIGGLIGGWLCGFIVLRAHPSDADASGDTDRALRGRRRGLLRRLAGRRVHVDAVTDDGTARVPETRRAAEVSARPSRSCASDWPGCAATPRSAPAPRPAHRPVRRATTGTSAARPRRIGCDRPRAAQA